MDEKNVKGLSYEDRVRLEYFLEQRYSMRKIAEVLGVTKYTVKKEIERGMTEGVYVAKVAHRRFQLECIEIFKRRSKLDEHVYYTILAMRMTQMPLLQLHRKLVEQGINISYGTLRNWSKSGIFDEQNFYKKE